MAAEAPGVGDNAIDDLLDDLAEVARAAVPRDPADVRAHRDAPEGFDRDLWRRFGDLGWLSLLVGDSDGGAGADERAAAVVARALGSAGRLEPFVAAGVLVPLWLTGLDGPAAADLLGPVMTGELQWIAGRPVTDLLRYEQAGFSALFRKSAVKRARLAGMQRNVAALTEPESRGMLKR